MLALLTITLLGLLFLTWSGRQGILAPSFLFTVGFTVCAVMLLFFNIWKTDISWVTFMVVALGVICFCVCTALIHQKALANSRAQAFVPRQFPICRPLLVAVILFEVVVIVWSAAQIMALFPSPSLSEAISKYGVDFKFHGGDGSLGTIIDNLRLACVAWTYFVCYLLAQEIIRRNATNCVLLVISFGMGCCVQLETGGRYGTFVFIAVFTVCYLILRSVSAQGKRIRLSGKQLLIFAVAAVAVLMFVRFGAVGRDTSAYGIMDYLAIYCGAELLNLDIFLNASEWFEPMVQGWITFGSTLGWIGDHLNIIPWQYHPNPMDILPYQEINGHDLGNVYTCFYNYILDFGYAGVFFCVVPMAAISQIAFEKAKGTFASMRRDMWIVLYAFIAIQLFMSFFSDKFYSELLSLASLKLILFFCIFRWAYLKFCASKGYGKAEKHHRFRQGSPKIGARLVSLASSYTIFGPKHIVSPNAKVGGQ